METTTTANGTDFPIPAHKRPKLTSMDFYTKTLGAPKLVVAPMVDQSELAWRLLCRRHGAQLCYSPMFHSNIFTQDPKYRQQALQSCPEDRPLIIQFCGNDPNTMLEAALLAQDHCDAIDINLGCPQAIAKRGHYGAFLQDEWDLLQEIVSTLHKNLLIPVTCKIRIFEDIGKTIEYAKMLVNAGCQLLTVHGRTRDQKGPLTGLADWKYIKAIKKVIKVPLFSNGNIMSMEDIDRCLAETNANGVMTAEGNLHNPAIFERVLPTCWNMAFEYLDIVNEYPCPASYIRGHLFKLFHHLLNIKSNADLRESMATSHNVNEFRNVVKLLKDKYQPMHEGTRIYSDDDLELPSGRNYDLSLPPWLCQPYIRMEPEEHKKVLAEKQRIAEHPMTVKRQYFDNEGNVISRKLSKRLRRVNRRPNKPARGLKKDERRLELCSTNGCVNPVGIKCDHSCCRICCREHCKIEILNCSGHKFQYKSRQKLDS